MPKSLPFVAVVGMLDRRKRSLPCDEVVKIDSMLNKDRLLPSGGLIKIGLGRSSKLFCFVLTPEADFIFERISSMKPEMKDEIFSLLLCFDATDAREPLFALVPKGTAKAIAGSACSTKGLSI